MGEAIAGRIGGSAVLAAGRGAMGRVNGGGGPVGVVDGGGPTKRSGNVYGAMERISWASSYPL